MAFAKTFPFLKEVRYIRRGIRGIVFAVLIFVSVALIGVVAVALVGWFSPGSTPHYYTATWDWIGGFAAAITIIGGCLEILGLTDFS